MWAFELVAPATYRRVTVATPEPSCLTAGQVMVRVAAGGICGSDLPYFRGSLNEYVLTPLGASLHEIAGEVVESQDDDLAVGTPVVGWATGMNGLAEYVITEGSSLSSYPVALSTTGAVMLQPLACVIYAVDQLARVEGRSVAVMGLGPIGLLFAHVLKASGADRVVGIDRVDRSELASSFRLDEVIHSSCDRWARSVDDDCKPDVIIEAIGHQVTTLADALHVIRPGGEVFYFGVCDDDIYPVSMKEMLRKNLTLRSGTTLDRRKSLQRAADYLNLWPELSSSYVTAVYPVDDAQRAYESAIAPSAGRLKIVLSY